MLYALYKCSDVREYRKGKSMKRKKSTQLLAVALTAAMLAQPVGARWCSRKVMRMQCSRSRQ